MFLRRTGLLPSPVVRLTPPVNDVPIPVVLTCDLTCDRLLGEANMFLEMDVGFLYVSIVCFRPCLVSSVANGASTFSNTRPDRTPYANFPLIFCVWFRFLPLTNVVLWTALFISSPGDHPDPSLSLVLVAALT